MNSKWEIRGRIITLYDLDLIKKIIKDYYSKGRKEISRQICHHWEWYQASGHTKDRACRDILLYFERKELIQLPSRINSANNERRIIKGIQLERIPLTGTVKDHPSLSVKLLNKAKEYQYWNRIVDTYHYQGHKVIVGQSLKYIAFINNNPVACLGWGSAAWSIESRDQWIGWNKGIKDKNLNKIVNNIRFLIFPWVEIKYLASHLLSLSIKRIREDWLRRFGNEIYLLETFVEKSRFKGTCYKASNWKYLGCTKGSSKRGSTHSYHGNIKEVYVYPLCKDFRRKLISR